MKSKHYSSSYNGFTPVNPSDLMEHLNSDRLVLQVRVGLAVSAALGILAILA